MTPRERLGLGALVALGLALRGAELTGRPLWLDEALQVQVATAPAWLDALARDDLHPPLFAALIRPLALGGVDEDGLRGLSLLASVATIPLAWWCGRAWASPRVGAIAAALVACSPPLVAYAGEARPYALGAALVTGFLAAVGARRRGLATLFGVGAVATLYGTWPVVLLGGALLARGGAARDAMPLAASALVAAALAVGLVPAQLAGQGAGLTSGHLSAAFWSPATLPSWLATQPTGLAGWALTGLGGTRGAVVGAPVLAGCLLLLARAPRDALTALAWAPALALAALAGLGLYPLGPSRHALVLLPPLALWLARAVETHPRPVLLAGVTLGALAPLRGPQLPVEDVPALVAHLHQLEAPLLVADASAAPQLAWYGPGSRATLPWRRGAPLQEALSRAAPPDGFWVVVGAARPEVLDEVRAWAAARGRPLGPLVVREGVWARRVGADDGARRTAGS